MRLVALLVLLAPRAWRCRATTPSSSYYDARGCCGAGDGAPLRGRDRLVYLRVQKTGSKTTAGLLQSSWLFRTNATTPFCALCSDGATNERTNGRPRRPCAFAHIRAARELTTLPRVPTGDGDRQLRLSVRTVSPLPWKRHRCASLCAM